MKDFIVTPGYSINPAHIAFVKFQKDGGVIIHVGNNALSFEGETAVELRKILAPAPKTDPAEPAAS